MKLNKQSPGVGKYLKYHKEKVTGGSLPNANQQLKPKMPLLEEVQQAYCAIPGNSEATSMELGAIEFCYDYITRHFGR